MILNRILLLIFIIIGLLSLSCTNGNIVNKNNELNIYDNNAIQFLENIVTQIETNNPNFYLECYCDTNENLILEPLELQFLEWEFSNSEEVFYLSGLNLIDGSKYLDSIPSSIGNLHSLKNIRIINSSITNIPMEIFTLQNLEILDLSKNEIQFLPNYFEELNDKLKILNFSNNKLTELPTSIFLLDNLEMINVNNNLITSIPEEVCSINSETIFSSTQNSLCIKDLVPNCYQDKVFYQTNCYSDLDISGIEALIDSNNISTEECQCDLNLNNEVDFFEIGIQKWEEWTDNANLLEFEINNIFSLPKITFEKLINLEILNVSHNNIDTIYNEIAYLTNLIELDLSFNNIYLLPDGILELVNLKKLKINNNDSLISIPILPQLDEINISYTNVFCDNDILNIDKIDQMLNNGTNVVGAYMQYCYMAQDITFINDMINSNGYFSDWQNTGVQNWSNGRLTSFKINNEINTENIPLSISNLNELLFFEISNSFLNNIPTQIENLEKLNSIILNNNNLDTLFIDFSKFNDLMYLNLSSNEIYEFPGSVCSLPIIEVNFENNRICDNIIPPCPIFEWEDQIQTQRCKNINDIEFIQELINENNIEEDYNIFGLQLWKNIEDGELDRLVFFEHIGGYNSNDTIYHLPNSISNVEFIEEINIINHSLEEFPIELFNLSELHSLNLSSNLITNLPEIYNLNYSLLNINLSQNNLLLIDDGISNLNQLNILDLSYNSLQLLPNTIGDFNYLTELDVSNNNLTSIPQNLENLISLLFLDLSSNQIDSLPEILCSQLTQLDWQNPNQFNVDDNKLCDENKIPSCIYIEEVSQNCD